jgi:hypothetical protein
MKHILCALCVKEKTIFWTASILMGKYATIFVRRHKTVVGQKDNAKIHFSQKFCMCIIVRKFCKRSVDDIFYIPTSGIIENSANSKQFLRQM